MNKISEKYNMDTCETTFIIEVSPGEYLKIKHGLADDDKFITTHKIDQRTQSKMIELPNGDYIEILYNDKYLYFENHIMEYGKTYTLDGYPVRFEKL